MEQSKTLYWGIVSLFLKFIYLLLCFALILCLEVLLKLQNKNTSNKSYQMSNVCCIINFILTNWLKS